jgi:signal transduction histidine kinase
MLESLKKKGLRFTFTTPKKTVFAVCDQDMIRQLLINLLDNARKFTSSGGSVTLSLSEENDCVNLSVSDTGVGIKPEDQSRIFERYAQVTYKGPLKQGGAGVGLAVCHHIVEKHHGEILLQSTLGMGSSFTAVLPKGLALPLKPGRVKAQKIS